MNDRWSRETGSTVDETPERELGVAAEEPEEGEEATDPVVDLAHADEVSEDDEDVPHEVRRDGSVAQFGSTEDREKALSQESYVRETGVDQGSEK